MRWGNPGPIRPSPSPSGPPDPQLLVESRLSRSRAAAHAQNRRIRAHLSRFRRFQYIQSRFAVHFLVDIRRRGLYACIVSRREQGYSFQRITVQPEQSTLTTYHELKQKAPARASLDNGTQAGIKHNRNKTNRCRADRPDMNNRL